ncbi:hypothetical protein ASPWEDRAFT_62228 [Aspergillus wentii DTO 134E9]|uniref:Uncharacterized protein n=1 Tax=Aspergillus wentii DTO 134E9 TaxID=1073089 RepID=A0A1L9R7D7_ASPWE|nr:uncharacterized protein ASPWEDRAFT_62228 [Aspergillus wentii DTO 134E9]OJJ30798.1 hypothetical protein ASPWEDRAFT_62228 [Aspergillus wentii DTO 134E9]
MPPKSRQIAQNWIMQLEEFYWLFLCIKEIEPRSIRETAFVFNVSHTTLQ